MNELISVIIPVYNNAKYFEKCILSVINQSYKNMEIIIINDGSTDNVKDIILKYKDIDERISYYENDKNMGVSYSRNFGLSKARGNYVYFLDSDDYIETECLNEFALNIDSSVSYSCMLRGYKEVNGVRTATCRTEEELSLMQSPSVDIRLFNKKMIDEAGIKFSDLQIAEDLEFIFKLYIYNNKVKYVDKALYTYVIHSDSSLRSNKEHMLDTILAIDSVKDYSKLLNKYDEFKEEIEFTAVSHILVGTVNRIMSFDDFSKDDVCKCTAYMNENFPLWMNNKFVRKYFLKNDVVVSKFLSLKEYGLVYED